MNNKFRIVIILCLILSAGLYVEQAKAACDLPSKGLVGGVQIDKTSYTAGDTIAATVTVAAGSNCDGTVVNFEICPILSSTDCTKAVSAGGATITGGAAKVFPPASIFAGASSFRIHAKATITSGPWDSFSGTYTVAGAGTCAVSSSAASKTGNNWSLSVTTNSNCEGKTVSFKLFREDVNGASIDKGIVASCTISGSKCATSFSTTDTAASSFQTCIGSVCVDTTLTNTGNFVCGNGACETGETITSCPADCKAGTTQTSTFTIPNPLKGGANTVADLVTIIVKWIFNLAIPIAVAMIVWSGIQFLTAQGDTGKITKAKDTLKWAVIGLAIILIGSGFISLIRSILDLGGANTAPTTNQNPGLPGIPPGAITYGCISNSCTKITDPTFSGPQFVESDCRGTCSSSTSAGGLGSTCGGSRTCSSGLICGNNSICRNPNGNSEGGPCVSGADCAQTLNCDLSDSGIQVIDGRQLGTCTQGSPQLRYSCVNHQCVESASGTDFAACSASCQ